VSPKDDLEQRGGDPVGPGAVMMPRGRVDAEARFDEEGAEGDARLVVEPHGGRVVDEGPLSSGLATTALAMAVPRADASGRAKPEAVADVDPNCRHSPPTMIACAQWNVDGRLMMFVSFGTRIVQKESSTS